MYLKITDNVDQKLIISKVRKGPRIFPIIFWSIFWAIPSDLFITMMLFLAKVNQPVSFFRS